MENTTTPLLSVSDFIAITNQTLEYAYPTVAVEGEVASFKVSQQKYVFFDLKDEAGSIGCFMTIWQQRVPIEDGMKVVVTATPKLTNWGKFSLTVRAVQPSGEGSLKRSFELLKGKLEGEGLFNPERKRLLPEMPQHIAVISSTQAAGYADFIKIIGDRWGGMRIDVAHVQVQGKEAPDQILRAIRFFNEKEVLPEVIVIIRGGGSADDLSAFNDELLVREIAASRVPIVVGVGHETDTSLADLAADVRAATPSNAAQLIVPDKRDVAREMQHRLGVATVRLEEKIDERRAGIAAHLSSAMQATERRLEQYVRSLESQQQLLEQLHPRTVLERGYAIVRGAIAVGNDIEIETSATIARVEVKHVSKKV